MLEHGNAHLNSAKTHQGSSDDGDPTERDPIANSPSQILLEALQNFVIPLIHAAEGENKKDISQVHMGVEAEKLLIALQEFISSMIVQKRIVQPQGIEVDLEDVLDDAKSPGAATPTDSLASDLEPSLKETALNSRIERMYTTIIGRIPEAVRKHVFSKMPIRVLHFTDIPGDSGSKLQITLLDRNGVCDRVIREIHARSSIVHRYIKELCKGIKEDTQILHDVAVRSIVLENTKYAILSHTWLRESDSEISYGDWQIGQHDTQKPGYQKLANFCKSAWIDHGLSFGWMDTVCINKDSSSELDESIRSMYKWYQDSDVCISYLAGTVTLGDIHRDAWFTRGWTFQELLAPRRMSFYNKDWKKFVRYSDPGNKYNPYILKQIFKATTITEDELRFPTKLSISRKMQLAAKRNVMREEDIAYSLMGICNVSISIAYGEGARRAFFRLMTEVLNTSSQVVDFFNCAQTDGRSIIPSGPSAYLQCSEAIMSTSPWHSSPIEPLLLTHVGLRTPILLMPSLRENDNCLENKPIGNYHAKLHLPALESINVGVYHVLDKGIRKSTAEMRWSFGILNFGGDTSTIHYRDRCLALCFKVNRLGGVGQVDWSSTSGLQFVRICTKEPIVFHLMKHGASTLGAGNVPYPIKRSELAMHGITLTTMYL